MRRVRLFALILALSFSFALAAADGQVTPVPPLPASPERPAFADWLTGFRSFAVGQGISASTLDRALTNLEPLPVVIERDRSQAEQTLSVETYVKRRATRAMVRTAKTMLARHATVLRQVEHKYGVSRQVLIAIWGLESNFGRFSGVRPTIQALATLAWEGRRGDMFRDQLLAALRIVDHGDIEPDRLKGSWAGAMGQVQFMPSTYLEFAQDFDGDGRKDIWSSEADVFASIANYLREHGWTRTTRWGYPVTIRGAARDRIATATVVRTSECHAERDMTEPLPAASWRKFGVRQASGAALPRDAPELSLLRIGARTYLVTRDYDALINYNCAHAYAMSVITLAQKLR